jgi:hypothetical protein
MALKPLSQMSNAERNSLLNDTPIETPIDQDVLDLTDAIEEKLKTQPPIYQDASKDRLHFLSSMDKKPKKGILGMFSKDDPRELSKYPPVKKVQVDPDFDVNKPGEVLKVQKKKGLLKEVLVAIAWAFHVLTVIGSIGFTYYMVTLLRAGVTTISDLSLLAVILSIQISLIGVTVLLGSVVRK